MSSGANVAPQIGLQVPSRPQGRHFGHFFEKTTKTQGNGFEPTLGLQVPSWSLKWPQEAHGKTIENAKEMSFGAIIGPNIRLQVPSSDLNGPQGVSMMSFW